MRVPSPSLPNATASTDDFEFKALEKACNYRKAVTQTFAPYLKNNVIEIGAGIGQMTNEFLQLPDIDRLLCVEPDDQFCQQHRKNLPGHELLHGVIEDVPSDGEWDAIVSINVLEHIEQDAAELVKYRARLAARRGHLCLLVPARPELYARIDRDFGHFRRYTKTRLEQSLSNAGFQIVTLRYFNLVGYFAWLWMFKLWQARHFAGDKVELFDCHIFPASQWAEQKLPMVPFGQSLIAVARA